MTGQAGHPWLGRLLGDAEMAALLSPEAELARMVQVEVAWTRVIAPDAHAARLAEALLTADISPYALAEGTTRDGVPVPALVRALRAGLSDEDHRWVHAGLTSQDVIDTSLSLMLTQALPLLGARLSELLAHLEDLSAREGDKALIARTRMQPALPIRVADRAEAWRRPLATLSRQWPMLIERCSLLQWGGPVGVRPTDLSADTGPRFATALGLTDPGHPWHTDRSHITDLAARLSAVTTAIGKIGLDVGLMAQAGKDVLSLSGGGGSSAMPHKQNPVRAEVCVALARAVAGDVSTLHHAALHEQERSGAAWTLEWLTLPRMLESTACALRTCSDLIGQITSMGQPR